MSKDIVTRLRKADKGLRQDIRSIPATSLGLLLEAADEIERLRAALRKTESRRLVERNARELMEIEVTENLKARNDQT